MKRLQFVLTIVLSAAFGFAAYAATDISAGERKKIVEVMNIIGAQNISRQVSVSFAQQLSYGLKKAQPDIDPKAFEIVSSITDEVLSKRTDELSDKMVPLYAKHFTEADLDQILAFYRSPIGRKTIETMPTLMQESMEMVIQEAQSSVPQIQERVTERLRADGLIAEKKK